MTTEAQINANQQNAQKSTGPRTPEGRAAVSQNALKHGLTATQTVIKTENRADYDLHRADLLQDLTPSGPMESMLAERIVSLSWRLRRAEHMHNQAIDSIFANETQGPAGKAYRAMLPESMNPPELALGRTIAKDFANARILERLYMYEQRIERSLYRTMREYQNLKENNMQNKPNLADDNINVTKGQNSENKILQNKPNLKTQMPVNKAPTDAYDEKTQDSRRNNDSDSDYMRSLYARIPMAMRAIEEMDAKSTE